MSSLIKIPTLQYIYDNLDAFEINKGDELYLIKLTHHIYGGPGAWYRHHINQIFVAKKYEHGNNKHQAIACLTEFVKSNDWCYALSGWVENGDCVKYPIPLDNVNDLNNWCGSKKTINKFNL